MAQVPPSNAPNLAPDAHGAGGAGQPPSRRALTLGLVLVITLVAFEALATATVMPAAQRELGGLRLYGSTFSAFLLASLVGTIWAGEQCDRSGPARPFLVGLSLFAVGLGVAGLAPSMGVLVAGRAIQGLGAGCIPAVAYVSVGRGYSEDRRPRILALFSTAWVVPGLAGPALAGAVAEYASWRLAFLGLLPLVLLAALLTVSPLAALGAPESPSRAGSRLRGGLLLAGGAAILLGGVGSNVALVGLPLAIGGAFVVVIALRRLMPPGIATAAPGLPAAIVGMGLLNLAFFGADAFVPLMLTRVRHQTPVTAGLVLTAATLSWTAGAWAVDRYAQRWGRRTMVRGGQACLAAGILGVILVLWSAVPVATAAAAWAVAGLGMGLAYSNFSLAVLSEAGEEEVGAATASLKLGESLSSAVGAGVGGAIVAAGEAASRETGAFAVLFALMVAASVLGLLLAGRLRDNRGAASAIAAVSAGETAA